MSDVKSFSLLFSRELLLVKAIRHAAEAGHAPTNSVPPLHCSGCTKGKCGVLGHVCLAIPSIDHCCKFAMFCEIKSSAQEAKARSCWHQV